MAYFSNHEKNDEDYNYQLIEFVSRGPMKTKAIDIVPSDWVSYKNGKLVTKFMPPPYTNETNSVLHSLVQSADKAPESWPIYTIKIKGHASEYFYYFYTLIGILNFFLILNL